MVEGRMAVSALHGASADLTCGTAGADCPRGAPVVADTASQRMAVNVTIRIMFREGIGF